VPAFLDVAGSVLLSSCTGNLVGSGPQRITLALVLDTRAHNRVTVIADAQDAFGRSLLETVKDALTSYPDTANHEWRA